jgi:hypothetical protein
MVTINFSGRLEKMSNDWDVVDVTVHLVAAAYVALVAMYIFTVVTQW